MKLAMLLLVSAVVLLVSPAVSKPAHKSRRSIKGDNMKRIFDMAKSYHNSSDMNMTNSFVESVENLATGVNKCGHDFFCKVHHILDKNVHFGKKNEMVQVLGSHVKNDSAPCDKAKQQQTSGDEIQVRVLMNHLMNCIQHVSNHKGNP